MITILTMGLDFSCSALFEGCERGYIPTYGGCVWCHLLSVSATVHVFDGTLMICLWYREGRVGWGGVGGLITFKYTSTHTSCYATARSSCTCTHTHTRHATLLHVSLALAHIGHATLGWGGVGGLITFKYTSTHTHTRHTTLLHVSLALAHTRHATLLHVSLALAHIGHAKLGWGGMGGLITFTYIYIYLHTSHATLLHVPLALAHTHTHVMLRLWEYIYQFVYRHNQKD